MTTRPCLALLPLLLGSSLVAQAITEPRAFLPPGFQFYVRADMARVRESEVWQTFARTPFVGKVIKDTPTHLGIDLEDVKAFWLGSDDVEGTTVGWFVQGEKSLKAESVRDAFAKREHIEFTAETIASCPAWIPGNDAHAPCVADLRQSAVLMAKPEAFLRDRLANHRKGERPKGAPEIESLMGLDDGPLFVAIAYPQVTSGLSRWLAGADTDKVQSLAVRIDLAPEFVIDARLEFATEAAATRQAGALKERIQEGAKEVRGQGLQVVAAMLGRLSPTVEGRQVRTTLKMKPQQAAAIVPAVAGLFLGLQVAADEAVDEFVPAPESKPASRPASRPSGR